MLLNKTISSLLLVVLSFIMVITPLTASTGRGSDDITSLGIDPILQSFLSLQGLTADYFDEAGNLVVTDSDGARGIISRNLLDNRQFIEQHVQRANVNEMFNEDNRYALVEVENKGITETIELEEHLDVFLSQHELIPTNYDQEGNLVVFDGDGRRGLVSKSVLELVGHNHFPNCDNKACYTYPNNSIHMPPACFAAMKLAIWVALNWDNIHFVIDVCSEVNRLIREGAILEGQGVHLPGEPYNPFYPSPHFNIVGGVVLWN